MNAAHTPPTQFDGGSRPLVLHSGPDAKNPGISAIAGREQEAMGEVVSFADLLRRYRAVAGLTQEELAERAGLSTRAISDLERGIKQRPYPNTVRRLVQALALDEAKAASFRAVARGGGETEAALGKSDEVGSDRLALPIQPTPFIGRRQEVEEVSALLGRDTVRLLTLTGPGGVGKTRLALHIAEEIAPQLSDGVVFVSLASLADPGLVPTTIAAALGVNEAVGQPILETLLEPLRRKRVLLVLDNFEHLLAAGEVVSHLLTSCPPLKLLVTSRAVLHLAAEHEYPVPPLDVPVSGHLPELSALSRYDGVQLFVQRAEAIKPGFEMTDENASAIAEICCRLDGLPLAIELAAARIRLFAPQALLTRLSDRLPLLTSGPRDAPHRQQSLRNTLDWSYSLLSPDEQSLFARLSVFAGGCSFESAEMVCNTEGRIDLFEALASLVEKSVVRREGEQEPRFSMLDTIREYAAERLEESGEGERVQEAHATYFVGLGEQAYARPKPGVDPALLDHLDQEHDNIRAALSWLEARSQWAAALQLVAGIWWFWWIRGHINEGRRHLDIILAHTQDTVSAERASAMTAASHLAMVYGALAQAGFLSSSAVELARQAGDEVVLGDALMTQGLVLLRQDDAQTAKQPFEESLTLARVSGRRQRVAIVTRALGAIAQREGNIARGTELIEESVAIHQELHDLWELSTDYLSLGLLANQRGEQAQAERHFRDSLRLAQRMGETDKIAYLLDVLGCLAVSGEDYKRAAHLFVAADALWETVEVKSFRRTVEVAFPDNDREMRTRCEVAAREVLGGEWSVVQRAVAAMSLDEVAAYALAESG